MLRFRYALHGTSLTTVANILISQAFTFLREFVLGTNPQGSVVKSKSGTVSVVGGEQKDLSGIIPGPDPIYYGNGGGGKTQSTYLFPTATRAAWKTFIATAQPTYFKRDNN